LYALALKLPYSNCSALKEPLYALALKLPYFECSVERAGGEHGAVRGDVAAGDLVVVAPQGGQRQPRLARPHLGRSVVAAGDQIVAGALLKLDPGDQLGVGGDGVLDVPLPQVPDLTAVILGAGNYVMAIRGPVHPCDAL